MHGSPTGAKPPPNTVIASPPLVRPIPLAHKRRWPRRLRLALTTALFAASLAAAAMPVACRLESAAPVVQKAPLGKLEHPRILVEKSLHRLSVYDGDTVVRTYRAAVGGGNGDKVREGDRCTPEGDFYVCLKNPESKYVLSLGLSYPNRPHADRGLRDGLITPEQHKKIVDALDAGQMPDWYTPLGGEIMIHGCGAGRNWTLGCVALDDDAIRELYPVIPLNTSVRIVP